ncbi:MAG: DUF1778 domain-containing protein [Burkholderiaceae bacterium]|nr:DUF1778 domain-containing protein [Burkholderiaceae bacterium]
MANTPVQNAPRAARLEARISETQKSLLKRAAMLTGRSLSEFVVASAQEAAQRVIEASETIQLSRAEQASFVQALLEPPAPSQRLAQAAKTYRARTGD